MSEFKQINYKYEIYILLKSSFHRFFLAIRFGTTLKQIKILIVKNYTPQTRIDTKIYITQPSDVTQVSNY